MRLLAVLLNATLVVTWFWLLSEKGIPNEDEALLAILMIAAPSVSLVSTFFIEHGKEDGLLSLYLKRRILEEREKIKSLS